MPTISVSPLIMQDGTVITQYKDTVSTNPETFNFQNPQEWVILYNRGTGDLVYTIGNQSGTLKPSEQIRVTELVSSVILSASSGTQAFELRMDEEGSKIIANDALVTLDSKVNDLTSQMAENAMYEMFPSLNVIDLEGMTVGNINLVRYNVKLGNITLA